MFLPYVVCLWKRRTSRSKKVRRFSLYMMNRMNPDAMPK